MSREKMLAVAGVAVGGALGVVLAVYEVVQGSWVHVIGAGLIAAGAIIGRLIGRKSDGWRGY